MSHPSLVEAARALATAAATSEPDAELRGFLATLATLERGQLGVMPQDREAFLTATAADIDRAYRPLHGVLHDLEAWLMREFQGDDWLHACEQRSRIEFVRSAYHDRLPDPGDTWMDPGEIDHLLRQAGAHEACAKPDDIPAGTPASHWWWALRAGG